MEKLKKFPFTVSDDMKLWVFNEVKVIEIIHDVDGKRYSGVIKKEDFIRLKKMMGVAGLPAAAIKAQLAIKRLIMNRAKWAPTKEVWESNKELAQWISDMEQELVRAHNALAEFNTEQQRKNMELIEGIGNKKN